MDAPAPKSIFARKRDLLYLTFFAIHIPIVFCVDTLPLYPEWMKPAPLLALRSWYIETYQDRFFSAPPVWFSMYIWMELLYHAPLSAWAVGALRRDDPKVPVHLLIYSCQTGITTMTCIAEYLSWDSFTNEQKLSLSGLYVPYLALSVFMGVDMFRRLENRLASGTAVTSAKKEL